MRSCRLAPAIAIGAAGCVGQQSALDPAGPAAKGIAIMSWLLLAIATVVVVAVIVLTVIALRRRPRARASGDDGGETTRAVRFVTVAGIVVPALVLTPILVYAIVLLVRLHPARQPADLVIEVTGQMWWWSIRYLDRAPENVFATANEIHIPVGRRVEARLLSPDVIHSFWVPSLQGKVDHIPGRENVIWIQADTPGVFRGQCAEYCGLQHARMAFMVVAHPPDEFERWRSRQLQGAAEPGTPSAQRGQQVLLRAGCATCHRVRGTPAQGLIGPDLTHVASRLTLAAGTLPNTRGHLAGWIANPQAIKRGTLMPPTPLSPSELHALLDYLETLR
jgi:cytochrome c oxidase subunit 2